MTDDSNDDERDARLDRLMEMLEQHNVGEDGVHVPGKDVYMLRTLVENIIARRTGEFLTKRQIQQLVDDRLEQIGLQVDKDHIQETGDTIRGAMKWHRMGVKAFWGAAGTVALGVMYELARKLGLPVPNT